MKKATIYDIAAELNISTATVNRALNNKPNVSAKTRALVLAKAEELGFTMNRAAKSLARRTLRMDFVIYNRVPVFHNEIIAGAKKAFEDLDGFNVSGEIHVFTGSDYLVHQRMLDKMQTLLEEKHDGLLLLGTFDVSGFPEMIRRFEENGLRVGLVGSDIPGSGRTFNIRQNDVCAGRLAAELLFRLGGNRPVAAFTGRPDNLGHMQSIGGFCEECSRRGVQVSAVYENHDDPEFAAYNTERLFREHPDIGGLYVNSANSEPVCRKLVQLGLGGKIALVTSDLFDEIRDYMRRDVVQATIFQDPFRQGYQAVEKMYKCLAEGQMPEDVMAIEPAVILQSHI